MKTILRDRILWHDGTIEVDPNDIIKWIKYKKLAVTELTKEIINYNKSVIKTEQIGIKTELDNFDTTWNIPDSYKSIDIEQYSKDKLVLMDISDDEIIARYRRTMYELAIYKKLNLYDLLRTLIYIIDMFKKNSIVWGVGRGSSVSSYVLYLLEVHDIDSIKYELDFNEFLS